VKKCLLAPVLLIFLSAACFLCAQEILPAKLQAVLIFKTLGYIKNAAQIDSGGKILLGILSDDNVACRSFSKDILENILMAKSSNYKVHNLELDPMLFKCDKEEALLDNFKNKNIKVLYIITQNDDNLKVILKVTRQLNILSMTGIKTAENVENGVSVGFGLQDNKPLILINKNSIKSEQKEFIDDFYPLTKTVESKPR